MGASVLLWFALTAARLRSGAVGRMHAHTLARGLCLLMLFMLAAGNAYVIWWNSLVPSLILAPLIAAVCAAARDGIVLQRPALGLAVCFAGFALISLISAAVNPRNDDTVVYWLAAYCSPLLIFIAVQSLVVDESFLLRCMAALTAGAMIPLAHGLVEYVVEWGIPTGTDLLISRYIEERMTGYMRATYGNTGNTAAYLALLLPAWIGLCVRPALQLRWRALFIVAAALGLLHVLIVQSRTLFLVLLLIIPCVLFFFRIRLIWFAAVAAALAAIIVIPVLGVLDQFSALTVGAITELDSDDSVVDRFDAMRFGIRSMLNLPAFGLGPANTFTENPYTTAHQYWIHQGSELGVWGFVLAVYLSLWTLTRFGTLVLNRAPQMPRMAFMFVAAAGPAAYMLYGCIANMQLASSVVNSWIGICAAMLGLSCCAWSSERGVDRGGCR
jgi:hypothetical protein